MTLYHTMLIYEYHVLTSADLPNYFFPEDISEEIISNPVY
jgi:hypothetical protein